MTSSPRRPRTSRTRTVVAARPTVSRGRIVTVAVTLLAVATAFGWRLVDLQLTPDAALAGEIGSQVRIIELKAPRGEIVDRHGRSIALSLPRPSVVADPRLVPDDRVDEIVARLTPLLTTGPELLRDRLQREKAFVYLERQVEPAVGEQVMDLELPGISLIEELHRDHPIGDCSGLAVAGRVDIDQNGISGLEKAYDDLLTGTDGMLVRQEQLAGDVQIPGGSQIVDPVVPGEDLRLTIERDIQFEAERRLVEAVEAAGAGLGIAVVADPATGEIIAMANVVRDDASGKVRCTTTNLAVTWAFEPGSTMKPMTFAAVFEHGAWRVDDPVYVPERKTYQREAGVEPFTFTEKYVEGDATHTPARILAKSSNNGTITLAEALGAQGVQETFVDFGFGARTALEFKGEASGILDDELDSHSLKLANAAIGQGVAVTAVQLVQGFNTLATAGLRVPLSLVMEDAEAEPTRIVSAETADTVLRLMEGVVTEGTGRRAAIPGFTVAGKTGTAVQACPDEPGYWCDGGTTRHYTASFGGVVQNDLGPALSVLVVIDDPQGLRYTGGEIAAPVFADIAGFALRQLRIPPSSAGSAHDARVRADPAPAVLPAEDASG